jgi:hypothetical protein
LTRAHDPQLRAFVDEVRGNEPELASYLRNAEREIEALGLNESGGEAFLG